MGRVASFFKNSWQVNVFGLNFFFFNGKGKGENIQRITISGKIGCQGK